MAFISCVNPPQGKAEEAYWFAFQNDRLMVTVEDGKATVPLEYDLEDLGIKPVREQYLGTCNGVHCYSAELSLSMVWPEGRSFLNLIELYSLLERDLYQIAVKAVQVVAWDRTNQFCGSCGNPTRTLPDERAKGCSHCGQMAFPKISPAIMVAVIRDKRILLAKNRTFRNAFYSVLAGFVDPGETLEECIFREVREEVGLEVTRPVYFGSQPWPFPNSLMIAFTAEYAGGEIMVDGNEIIEADWFSADRLPNRPKGGLSIAGRLIDWFRETYQES